MISITADRIKTAGLIGTAFLSAAKGITVYGNKLLAVILVVLFLGAMLAPVAGGGPLPQAAIS